MDDDDVLRAIGRAIEEQARTTRYVLAIGFVVLLIPLISIAINVS